MIVFPFAVHFLNVWKIPRKVSEYKTTETPNMHACFRQQSFWLMRGILKYFAQLSDSHEINKT